MSKISDALARLDFTIGRRDSAVGVLEGPTDQAETADQAEAEEAHADSEEEVPEPEMELAPVGVNHEAFGSHDEAIAASQKSLTTFAGAKSLPVKNEAVLALWDASKGHKGAAREFDALAGHLDGQENAGAAGKARTVAKSHRDAAMQIEKAAIGEEHTAPDAIEKAEAASAELTEKLKDLPRSEDLILIRNWAEWDAAHKVGDSIAKLHKQATQGSYHAHAQTSEALHRLRNPGQMAAGAKPSAEFAHIEDVHARAEHRFYIVALAAKDAGDKEMQRKAEAAQKAHFAVKDDADALKRDPLNFDNVSRPNAMEVNNNFAKTAGEAVLPTYGRHAKRQDDVAMARRHLDRIETRKRTA